MLMTDILINEHKQIERELIEMETIMNTSIINYPNLLHVLKKLRTFWNEHEKKEEIFFSDMQKKGFTIPVQRITFEHGKLHRDMEIIMNSIQRGSDDEMHTILSRYGKDLVSKIRKHMSDEDWILYALPKKY